MPSSISSNVSSTCSEISTTAAFTDLSNLSSSSSEASSSSGEDDSSNSSRDRRSHHGRRHRRPTLDLNDMDDMDDDDSTCETRTLRDEQATPIMDPESGGHLYVSAAQRFLNQTQVGDYELVDSHLHQHLATPQSPSTPDLLYPHTHLTTSLGAGPVNLPINQNGLPVLQGIYSSLLYLRNWPTFFKWSRGAGNARVTADRHQF